MMENFLNIFPSELLVAISRTILHSLWQGLLISAMVFLALLLTHRSAARTRYAIAGSGLLLLLVTVTVTFLFVYRGGSDPVAGATQARATGNVIAPWIAEQGQAFTMDHWKDSFISFFDRYASWFSLLWFLGMMIFLLRSFGGILYVTRIRSRSLPLPDARWQKKLMELANRLGVGARIKLAESIHISTPVLVGFLRPVIILPVGLLTGLSTGQVEAILVHELMHIRRKDYLVNLIQAIAEALLFFNPAVWWLSSQMRVEREHICDDAATSHLGQPLDYARALASLEESRISHPQAVTALTGRRKYLLNRIKRMMNMKNKTNHGKEGIMIILFTLLSVLMISAGAAITYTDQMKIAAGILKNEGPASAPYHEYTQPENNSGDAEMVILEAKVSSGISTPDTVNKEKQMDLEKEEQHKKAMEEVEKEMEFARQQIEQAMKEHDMKLKEHQVLIEKNLKQMQDKMIQAYEGIDFDTSFVYVYNGDTVKLSRFWHGYHPGSDEWVDKELYIIKKPGFDFEVPDVKLEIQAKEMEKAMEALEEALMDVEEMEHDKHWDKYADAYSFYYAPEVEVRKHDRAPGFFVKPDSYGHFSRTARIIQQELYSDGLIRPGKEYVLELNEKQMLINGEKQSRSIQKKYERLYESLEGESPVNYKKIF